MEIYLRKIYGFKCERLADKTLNSASTPPISYAFWSNNQSATVQNIAYNFYAAGSAPNYFAGNVGIGTDAPNSVLHVVGDILSANSNVTSAGITNGTADGFIINNVKLSGCRNTSNTPEMMLLNRGGGVSGRKYISFSDAGTEFGSITTNGANITINGQTSDYRIKTNIQPLPSAVDLIKAIKPVTFEYTDRNVGQTYKGFIAHELQEVGITEAVVGTKDETEAIGTLADYDGTVLETEVTEPEELEYTEDVTDEYGVSTQTVRTRTWTPSGTRPVYQGVDQTKLIPLLTKALQEALTEIDTLKGRLDNLES